MPDVPIQIIPPGDDLDPAEARALTAEIRNNVAELEMLLVRAYRGRAWLALGHESWDAYIHAEFKAAPLALPREERRAASQSLAGWGLSTRAIASATGAPKSTIADDLSGNRTPAPVVGLDGKTYTPPPPRAPADPAPPVVVTCPTCHGTGKVER